MAVRFRGSSILEEYAMRRNASRLFQSLVPAVLWASASFAAGEPKFIPFHKPNLIPIDMSADGTKVVGSSYFGSPIFSWSKDGGIAQLGGGCTAGQVSISGDGSTIVGCVVDATGVQQAATWLGGTDWNPLGSVAGAVHGVAGRAGDRVLGPGQLACHGVLLLGRRVPHAGGDVRLVGERRDGVAHVLAGLFYLSFDCARVFAHWMSSLIESRVRPGIGAPASFNSSRPRSASTAATTPTPAPATCNARFHEFCLMCSPIAIAAGNSSNTKVIPHGPVIEASCKNGRNFSCEYARLPADPCGDVIFRTYSLATQTAGKARTPLHTAPRKTSMRNSSTPAAKTTPAAKKMITHADPGIRSVFVK
jgi:hypothetical protein